MLLHDTSPCQLRQAVRHYAEPELVPHTSSLSIRCSFAPLLSTPPQCGTPNLLRDCLTTWKGSNACASILPTQSSAKKKVLGYSKALAASDLPQVCARRQELCRNFSMAAFRSQDFRHWFSAGNLRQARHAYYLRNNNQLSLLKCRRDPLKNSAVHYLTRLLNAK